VISQIPSNLDGGPLQHLCWSPNGSDLAVIDSAGRVSILAIHNALNKPNLIRSAQIDPAEDLHAVVGTFWLNVYPLQQRPVCLRLQ
jgi:mediator of RNA polymerase II transcription subunit 16, fungi type